MEKFIRNNWFVAFIVIFFLMLIVLSGLGIFLNNGILGFFWGGRDDKRLDVMSSVILASVTFASALVAIILARTALLFAENEEKREFKNRVEDRIKDIQSTSQEIMLEAKKLGVDVKNYFDEIDNNIFSEILEPEFTIKKLKKKLDNIQNKPLFFMLYNDNSRNSLKEIKICLNLFKKDNSNIIFSCIREEVNYINLQREYQNKLKDKTLQDYENKLKDKRLQEYRKLKKYRELKKKIELKEYKNKLKDCIKDPLFTFLNNIEKEFKNPTLNDDIYSSEFKKMREKIINKFIVNNKFNQDDYLIWLNLFIYLSLFKSSSDLVNKKRILDPIKVINIFINLPDTHNFINFSNKLDKEFWKTNREYAIDTICILSENNNDNLKKILIEIRNFFIDLQEKDLSYIIEENNNQEEKQETNFEKFKNLIKGVAIKNNQKEINANVIFTAMSYLDLSPYGKAVFSKMMGDHFYRIEPATGGQEYIDLADSKREENIPLDVNMKIFVDEVEKHLGDEKFFNIR